MLPKHVFPRHFNKSTSILEVELATDLRQSGSAGPGLFHMELGYVPRKAVERTHPKYAWEVASQRVKGEDSGIRTALPNSSAPVVPGESNVWRNDANRANDAHVRARPSLSGPTRE